MNTEAMPLTSSTHLFIKPGEFGPENYLMIMPHPTSQEQFETRIRGGSIYVSPDPIWIRVTLKDWLLINLYILKYAFKRKVTK